MLFSRQARSIARLLFVAVLLFAAGPALAQGHIQVDAIPIKSFDKKDPELRRFGKLEYRGGVELKSSTKEFGGFSSLIVYPDGSRFISATDTGRWLRGRITYSGSAPTGIADAEMAQMLGGDGKKLPRGWFDTESIAEDNGTIYVGLERVHRILKYDFGKDGFKARGVPIPVPVEFKGFPSNQSLEAMAVAPKGHPLAGTLVVITERVLDGNGNIKGYFLNGKKPGVFSVKRLDEFDVTDCAFLPGGDLAILERKFQWLRGYSRIRRIAAADLEPGATVNGPVLMSVDFDQQIDNFEGLAAHRAASGETVLTLISDDNFSPLQRTLLMQFTLVQ